MGQPDVMVRVVKCACQPAALVINENKGHFVRVVIDRHGENVGDNKLAFSGAGHAGHQAVGPLVFLVQVKGKGQAVGSDPHRRRQGEGGIIVLPPLQHIQVLHLPDAKHLQDGVGFGEGEILRYGLELGGCQLLLSHHRQFRGVGIQPEFLILAI